MREKSIILVPRTSQRTNRHRWVTLSLPIIPMSDIVPSILVVVTIFELKCPTTPVNVFSFWKLFLGTLDSHYSFVLFDLVLYGVTFRCHLLAL